MGRKGPSVLLVSVLLMISTLQIAFPTPAIDIDRTDAGDDVINVTFPREGGYNDDIRFTVQTDAHVGSTSLDIIGTPEPWNASFRHEDQPDFIDGNRTNVTISDGNVMLQDLEGEWKVPEGWLGAALTNVSIVDGKAILNRSIEVKFKTNIRIDNMFAAQLGHVDIAVDPAGRIHAVYNGAMGIEYMSSDDNGSTWNFITSWMMGGPGSGPFWPQVFAAPNGYIHIFTHYEVGGAYGTTYIRSENNGTSFTPIMSWGFYPLWPRIVWDGAGTMHFTGYTMGPDTIYYWNSTNDGDTISTPVPVNDTLGGPSNKSIPNIAIDPQGKIHIVWADDRDAGTDSSEVFYSNSTDHENFSVDWAIETRTNVDTGEPFIAVDSSGKVHVVWSDDRTSKHYIYYTNSTDGGTSFIASRAVDVSRGLAQTNPCLDIGPDDAVHLSWDDGSGTNKDVAYSVSGDHGTSFMKAAYANDNIGAVQNGSEMDVDYNGTPHLLWFDDRDVDAAFHAYYTNVKVNITFALDGEVTGTVDLGTSPVSLDRTLTIAEEPPGTDVTVMVRTSPDNVGWNDWEEVDLDDTSIQGPPGRFVNWKVVLNSTDIEVSPSVANLTIEYSYYPSEGIFISDLVVAEDPVSNVTVGWNATNEGLLAMKVSNDNGTSWMDAPNGKQVNFTVVLSELRYMALFSSAGNATSVLTDIDVSYRSLLLPTDLELDVGADSTVDWSHPGALGTKETVHFTEPLASFLEANRGSDEVEVILRFSSKSAGMITVSNIHILMNLPPIIHDSVPVGTNASMDEGTHLSFGVNASDPDGKGLIYRWFVDGTAVTGATGPAYNHSTGFDDSGGYTIMVEISDGHFTINRTWRLDVGNVNRLPYIVSFQPDSFDIQLQKGDLQNLSIIASDPDGDPLSYKWTVDDVQVSGALNASLTLDTGPFVIGAHNVTVVVSDGELEAGRSWNLTVHRAPPRWWLESWEPEGDVVIKKGEKVNLKVVMGTDGEVTLDYAWYVDDGLVEGATGPEYTFKGKRKGEHIVKVVISNETSSGTTVTTDVNWKVTVKERKDDGLDAMAFLWWIVLVIVIVVVILVLVLGRKGKGRARSTTSGTSESLPTTKGAGGPGTPEEAPTEEEE